MNSSKSTPSCFIWIILNSSSPSYATDFALVYGLMEIIYSVHVSLTLTFIFIQRRGAHLVQFPLFRSTSIAREVTWRSAPYSYQRNSVTSSSSPGRTGRAAGVRALVLCRIYLEWRSLLEAFVSHSSRCQYSLVLTSHADRTQKLPRSVHCASIDWRTSLSSARQYA
ncbi:hypothetical protein BC629DRAFT_1540568 [Irpex lacteus]|nr:hypothetical protein BC629DRAFT_1540568 [Irpex lacteus]